MGNLTIFLLIVWTLCVNAPEVFIITKYLKEKKRNKDGNSK